MAASPYASVCGLLGFLSNWDCLVESDLPAATELLATFVAQFLEAVPGIVAKAEQYEREMPGKIR